MNADEAFTKVDLNSLTERVIGCAFEVSNVLGVGFLESVYETSLAIEFERQGLAYERQPALDVFYKGVLVGHYVPDLIVEKQLVVEVKALPGLTTNHEGQLLNYLKATSLTVGLLLNFGRSRVEIRRLVRGFKE